MICTDIHTLNVQIAAIVEIVDQLVLVCYAYNARRSAASAQAIIPQCRDDHRVVIKVFGEI